MLLAGITNVGAMEHSLGDVSTSISLKVPGNDAQHYSLTLQKQQDGVYTCQSSEQLPLVITRQVVDKDGKQRINVVIMALDTVYFNYGEQINTGYRHSDCQFYMPGFWYRQNLRSPEKAPSFHTSDSWLVREDRLSSPLTAAFNSSKGKSMSVIRIDKFDKEALATHKEGEVIVSGETSIGYTGFENIGGMTVLSYGFPYKEAPKTYIRKLTLAPSVEAFQLLRKGDSITLTWELSETDASDFSECVQRTWEYCYDTNRPQPVNTPYTVDRMKDVLSNFFVESYVNTTPTHYYSGVELKTATCASTDVAEVGFVGRTLLNAFNALEYGFQQNRPELVNSANSIFDTYLSNGFSPAGFFNEVVHYNRDFKESNLSIRRQSEGVYALSLIHI